MKQGRAFFGVSIALVIVAGLLCGFRLIEYQIVRGDDYLKAIDSFTVSETTINAARGKIVDRNGVELATNASGFSLVFDRVYMKSGSENETVVALQRILREKGETWIDELPVSQTEPYAFLPGEEAAVERLKKKLGMQTYATAEDCMEELIRRFSLESYTGEELRALAGVRYGMLLKDFSLVNSYTFAENISPETVAIIEELNYRYPGVRVSVESIRTYTEEGNILPQIIGTMSAIFPEEADDYLSSGYALNERVGRSGIEAVMQEELRGVPGKVRIQQNSNGDVVSTTVTETPIAGNTIKLTIDIEFQKRVMDILANFVAKLRADGGRGKEVTSGSIVVLNARNGEVLAVANYPTYTITDLSDAEINAALESDPLNPKKNRAFREIYRPGSTFKTITATAALCEGVIEEHSTVYCGHVYTFDTSANPYQPVCTGFHNNLNVVEALKVSCNIFFYDVGRRLGIDRIDKYAAKFGLGEETGLEIANAKGQVASPAYSEANGEVWYPGNTWQAAIGQQETRVTPLQLALQGMTLGNKGVRYAAHLIREIDSYDGSEVIEKTEPEVLSNLSGKEKEFDIVQHGMREVADRRPTMVNIKDGVAIKTGTPQVTETTYNSVTVGFYPARTEVPEISFATVLELGEYSSDMMAQVINVYNELKAERGGTF